jgi:hypothetical protein
MPRRLLTTLASAAADQEMDVAKAKRSGTQKAARGRDDGRLQVLLYMKEPLVKALKSLAIEEDTTAYQLAEEAVEALLKSRRAKR